jgi:TusA-related sulfurtransferase
MIFDKVETKNLLNMLCSSDTENATLAFEALKGVDIKKYLGELIVLYKFGKKNMSIWEKEAPKCHKQLVKLIEPFIKDTGTELSSGSCLSAMTTNNASNQSIELFMELFTDSMIGFLAQMGYPADKFEINIKLKDGQSTNS